MPESRSSVVVKAMALGREDCYESVPELQRDIEAYPSGFATSAENAGLLQQPVELVRRPRPSSARRLERR